MSLSSSTTTLLGALTRGRNSCSLAFGLISFSLARMSPVQVYTFLFDVKTSNYFLVPSRVIYLGEVSVNGQGRVCFVSEV